MLAKINLIAFTTILLISFSSSIFAAIGVAQNIKGFVTATDTSGATRELNSGDDVHSGEIIETSGRSSATLVFSDEGQVSLRSNTTFRIVRFNFSGKDDDSAEALFQVTKGSLTAVTGTIKDSYRLDTPISTITVDGTTFQVELSRDAAGNLVVDVFTLEGAVIYSTVVTGTGQSNPLPDGFETDNTSLEVEVDDQTGEVQSISVEAGTGLSQDEVNAVITAIENMPFTPEPGDTGVNGDLTPSDTTPDGGSPI